MSKEKDTLKFLNRFTAKNILEDFGSDFVRMDKEERTKFLLNFAGDIGVDPETINFAEIAEIAESGDFQQFVEEAYERIHEQPPDLPSTKVGL